MNNEPVAWRTHYPSGWEYKDGNPPFELKGNSQLLYTHLVKEQLSDEEIAVFLYAYCLDMGDVYEVSEEQFIKCVRAILKEAQEK